MPKFTVQLQQYVEMLTTVEVEASDEREAIDLAKSESATAIWKDGDDAYSVDAYAVHDAAGELVWER